ncbi:MAG: class I SAM-dependent rRNA methyltransferase [Chitinophagales bacterium]|nr:class I SAM-dependent rRNA methyltransferase [Chitinophagales bacterium]
MPKILHLKKGKEASIMRRHPWVFSGAIKNISGNPSEGDLVHIQTADGTFLASAFYQQQGSISARIVSFEAVTTTDQTFWGKKLSMCLNSRQKLGLLNNSQTNCFRLVNAEGDEIPGLIIDIYNRVAVFQAHNWGIYKQKTEIVAALLQILPPYNQPIIAIYNKSADTLPKNSPYPLPTNGYLWQEEAQLSTNAKFSNAKGDWVTENGLNFWIDWELGQKTGFFLDQRDNRKLLATYAKNANVLNAFCYSGGFSVYALQNGAAKVVSIDSSQKAIDWANKNVQQNFPDTAVPDSPISYPRHQTVTADVLPYLQQTEANQFNLIVLDPPAFAKNLAARHAAVQGYKRLNAQAMRKIEAGGILFTFSCSGVVTRELFNDTICAAAIEANRSVRILHHLAAPTDHPVNIFHPEGAYLKGLVVQVF